MKKIGTKREMAEFGGKFMLLLAAFLLIPIPIRANATGSGGVVMMTRVSGSGSGSGSGGSDSSSCLSSGSGSSNLSVQDLFNYYAYLDFRGTSEALTNLDQQIVAYGSPDARLRVSTIGVAAAGAQVVLSVPTAALNGITTWLDTAAIAGGSGGSGGVIFATAGSIPLVTTWTTGTKVPLDLASLATSALLWNLPVELLVVPANSTNSVKLKVTVVNSGNALEIDLRPNLSPIATN